MAATPRASASFWRSRRKARSGCANTAMSRFRNPPSSPPSRSTATAEPFHLAKRSASEAPTPARSREEGEHKPRYARQKCHRLQQQREDRRIPERLPDVTLDHPLGKVEAAWRDHVPDLASRGQGEVPVMDPEEDIPAQRQERRRDQQPADEAQNDQA